MKYLRANECVVKVERCSVVCKVNIVCATPHEKCPRCGNMLKGSCPKEKNKFSFNKDCFLFGR